MKNILNKLSLIKGITGCLVICIFTSFNTEPGSNPMSSLPDTAYTFLALGDSYTFGESIPVHESFPYMVVKHMQELGFKFNSPSVIAKTGWTTDELQNAISKSSLLPVYDFVTLLIGVNNQYRGLSKENYRQEFESLLRQALKLAGDKPGHVIVISIPDWGVTTFAANRDREQIANQIDSFNMVNQELSQKYKTKYINITAWTREATSDPALLAMDGLHPSGREYARWAEAIAGIIREQL